MDTDDYKYSTHLNGLLGNIYNYCLDVEKYILESKFNSRYPNIDWRRTILLPHIKKLAQEKSTGNETAKKYAESIKNHEEQNIEFTYETLDITTVSTILCYDNYFSLGLDRSEISEIHRLTDWRNNSYSHRCEVVEIERKNIKEGLKMLREFDDKYDFVSNYPKLAINIYTCGLDFQPDNVLYAEKLEMARNIQKNKELYQTYYKAVKERDASAALAASGELYKQGDNNALQAAGKLWAAENMISADEFFSFFESLEMDEAAEQKYHADEIRLFRDKYKDALNDDAMVEEIRRLNKDGCFSGISYMADPLISGLFTAEERAEAIDKSLRKADGLVQNKNYSAALSVYKDLVEQGVGDACRQLVELCRNGVISIPSFIKTFEDADESVRMALDIGGLQKLELSIEAASRSEESWKRLSDELSDGEYSRIAMYVASYSWETVNGKWKRELDRREERAKEAEHRREMEAEEAEHRRRQEAEEAEHRRRQEAEEAEHRREAEAKEAEYSRQREQKRLEQERRRRILICFAAAVFIVLILINAGVRKITRRIEEKRAAEELEYNSEVMNFLNSGLYRGSINLDGIYYDLSMLVRDEKNLDGSVPAIIEFGSFKGETTPDSAVYVGTVMKDPEISSPVFTADYRFDFSDKWKLTAENTEELMESWDKVKMMVSRDQQDIFPPLPSFSLEMSDEDTCTVNDSFRFFTGSSAPMYREGSRAYDEYVESVENSGSVLAELNPHAISNICLYTSCSPNEIVLKNGDVTSEAFFLIHPGEENATVSFDLNGNYSHIGFELEFQENGIVSDGYLQLIGDGSVLLEGNLGEEHGSLEADVTGVQKLEFRFSAKRGGWCFGGSSAVFYNFNLY